MRYDWQEEPRTADRKHEEPPRIATEAQLVVNRVTQQGSVQPLITHDKLPPRKLRQINLGALRDANGRLALLPGDVLEFQLMLSDNATVRTNGDETSNTLDITKTLVVLRVGIVEETVIPVPEAAYALLHYQQVAHEKQVECARFAWNPPAARVELICPDDLLSEIVRRRAVFHWFHSARPGRHSDYAIQKITQTGSTSIPQMLAEE